MPTRSGRLSFRESIHLWGIKRWTTLDIYAKVISASSSWTADFRHCINPRRLFEAKGRGTIIMLNIILGSEHRVDVQYTRRVPFLALATKSLVNIYGLSLWLKREQFNLTFGEIIVRVEPRLILSLEKCWFFRGTLKIVSVSTVRRKQRRQSRWFFNNAGKYFRSTRLRAVCVGEN